MFGLDFATLPIWTNVLIFLAGAAVIWMSGARLVRVANAISDKTGMAQAFAGMLLLGTITTQPEISASVTSAASGNAPLAVNNLLGSLSFNVLILVLADALVRRHALTAVIVGPSILLQGALGLIGMGIVAFAITTNSDQLIAGIGLWPIVLLAFVIFAYRLASRYDRRAPWRTDRSIDPDEFSRVYGTPTIGRSRLEGWGLASLIGVLLALAAVVFAAGITLSRVADALAVQTGLGAGPTGLVLLALATSLPEITIVTFAVRMRRFELAIGEVLGANIFNLAILFFADIAYSGPPILSEAGAFETGAALLALLMTAILLVGLLEQRNRHLFGLGFDSWAILIVYLGGIGIIYSLA